MKDHPNKIQGFLKETLFEFLRISGTAFCFASREIQIVMQK